jgi:hypothetical protein
MSREGKEHIHTQLLFPGRQMHVLADQVTIMYLEHLLCHHCRRLPELLAVGPASGIAVANYRQKVTVVNTRQGRGAVHHAWWSTLADW